MESRHASNGPTEGSKNTQIVTSGQLVDFWLNDGFISFWLVILTLIIGQAQNVKPLMQAYYFKYVVGWQNNFSFQPKI